MNELPFHDRLLLAVVTGLCANTAVFSKLQTEEKRTNGKKTIAKGLGLMAQKIADEIYNHMNEREEL